MKSKHLNIYNLPLTEETYNELRKALRFGKLKWLSLSKELQNAYHSFDKDKRETDFEKQIHKLTPGACDYDTPI
ncbi:hypothetical protein [uncultured Lutibacter sp.]|uniref:hypothetical protein n=1 Tax=uncultured Lutibacter sp. TaxID=437739 RepID=UPI0026192517|nr:hypothetical protein [uncultured Lutibacter sp.]